MCPSTSGVGSQDVALSLNLAEQALFLASEMDDKDFPQSGELASSEDVRSGLLARDGCFVVKLLEGQGTAGENLHQTASRGSVQSFGSGPRLLGRRREKCIS